MFFPIVPGSHSPGQEKDFVNSRSSQKADMIFLHETVLMRMAFHHHRNLFTFEMRPNKNKNRMDRGYSQVTNVANVKMWPKQRSKCSQSIHTELDGIGTHIGVAPAAPPGAVPCASEIWKSTSSSQQRRSQRREMLQTLVKTTAPSQT